MDADSLIRNKTVKVKDYGLLQAFFPEYAVRETLPFFDNASKVLYVGKWRSDIKKYLSEHYEGYILPASAGEVVLDNNVDLFKFVYSKWDKKPSDKVLDYVKDLEESTAISLAKVFWVTGRLRISSEQLEHSAFDVFASIPETEDELVSNYLNVIEHTPVPQVESSLCTMLSRLVDTREQNVKIGYLKVLNKVKLRVGNSVPSCVRAHAMSTKAIPELALLNFLLALRSK